MEKLKTITKKILSSLLTEELIKKVVLFLLKELSKQTSNKVDDEVIKLVEEALKND